MNNVVYAEPYHGLEWTGIICLLMMAAVVIMAIWNKIGQGKK